MTKSLDGSLHERIEALYVNDDLGIFFATGQPLYIGGRRAYIAVKSMHTLTETQCASLRGGAKPFSESRVRAHVNPETQKLDMYDEATRTSTMIPLTELSEAVQKKYPPVKVQNYFDRLSL